MNWDQKTFFYDVTQNIFKKKFCTDNFYSLKLWFSINQPRPPKWGFKKYFLKGPCTKNIQFKFQQNWFINGWVVAIWKNSITLPNFAHPLSIYHDPTLKMPSSLQIQTLTSQPFIVWFALNLDWIFLMSMPFDTMFVTCVHISKSNSFSLSMIDDWKMWQKFEKSLRSQNDDKYTTVETIIFCPLPISPMAIFVSGQFRRKLLTV